MTRAEINRLSRQFRIQKQNKGENRPGFVFTNPEAGAELPQLVYKNQETGLTIKLLIDSAGIVMYI
jgi:hypothetical protein